MSGSRQKALKMQFERHFNRKPNKTTILATEAGYILYQPSEWRRLKKAYKNARRGLQLA